MSEWRDIETADKDSLGRNILLWSENWHDAMVGFWRSDVKRWGWYGNGGVKNEKFFQPTHWQPLPPPPHQKYNTNDQ